MKLVTNWKSILTKSYTVNLSMLGAVAETILRYNGESMPSWAVITLLVLICGARVVAQDSISGDKADEQD